MEPLDDNQSSGLCSAFACLALSCLAAGLMGCNTLRGMGEDLEDVGEAVTHGIDRHHHQHHDGHTHAPDADPAHDHANDDE